MGAFIGPSLLTALVAEKAKKSVEEVEATLTAYNTVVRSLLDEGARVRALDVGYFEVIKKKATRRKSPMIEVTAKNKGYINIPSKKKIVFRESRKK
jgi:nucleoid DNA-binding protein